MEEFCVDGVCDNIEFTAVDIDTYTIWLNKTGTDTATVKFPTANPVTARKIQIRTDKNTDLVEMNLLAFTDPVQITADTSHIEQRNVPTLNTFKIRTTATNTTIKVRWF